MTQFSAEFFSIKVTQKTNWHFVSLSDGYFTGWGEATLNGHNKELENLFKELSQPLDVTELQKLKFQTLPNAALSSALLQAYLDLRARKAKKALSESLGGIAKSKVGVYANINRRTTDRSCVGMAQSAKEAIRKGHKAIKIAPFDEVHPDMSGADMRVAMEEGLCRIVAVKEVIGEKRLMIDCHWRFDFDGAKALIDACSSLSLYWIECPISEKKENIPLLKRLRSRANAFGIRLAGLETAICRRGFLPYAEAGAYDVMMPDVKYCGGPLEMMAIATDLDSYGIDFSPHNPSGPICHLHSLNICAVLSKTDLLEMQFDESPMFNSLLKNTLPPVAEGEIELFRDLPGLGASLTIPKLE